MYMIRIYDPKALREVVVVVVVVAAVATHRFCIVEPSVLSLPIPRGKNWIPVVVI